MKKAIIILLAAVMGTCSKPPTTLDEILEGGVLRVVTRNSPTTYYRGAVDYEGPEYLLMRGFRNFLSTKYGKPLQLDIETVDRFGEIFPAIESGRSHIAAAGLTITAERQQRVTFGPTYQEVKQSLIYRLGSGKPRNLTQLYGKRIEVMSGSSYVETLHDIQDKHPDLSWSENPNVEISELLMAVETQKIDYTVADTTAYEVHRHYMPDLRIAMNLKDSDQLAWAFEKHNSASLRVEVAQYFKEISNNGMLSQILDRYYGHTSRFDYVGTRTFIRHYDSRLNAYQPLFEKAAEQYSMDWRLLASIGYQESHWDPEAVSPTGVRGMMMLTKVTADSMGIENREDPIQSIPAAARYFKNLHKRLGDIPEPDRTWFALAAYNVGYGHLQDARDIVRKINGNPDRWLDVKEALPKLAKREWFTQARHGYARGWEPVRYVSNVRNYFGTLNWLTLDRDNENENDNDNENDNEPETDVLPRDSQMQTASGDMPISF
jgi:membrane-bound lytic murein transglycosylase F